MDFYVNEILFAVKFHHLLANLLKCDHFERLHKSIVSGRYPDLVDC